MNIFAKEELVLDGFVQAAAPSGTDAYHINGNALHSVLYLPVGTSKCLPLHHERLNKIQEIFSNGGLLFMPRREENGRSENIHHGQKTPPGVTPKLQGHVICEYLLGTSCSCHQSAIICYSKQMPLIPADTTYTICLTMPSPSTNLCDSNEQTNQTPGHSGRAWVKLCLREKIGGHGG